MNIPEHYILYKILKQVVPSGYTITYDDMDELAAYQCGTKFTGTQVSKYRDMTTGLYLEKLTFLDINVNGDIDRHGALSTEAWCYNIINILNQMRNMTYYIVDGTDDCTVYNTEQAGSYTAFIRQIDSLSDVVPLPKSEQGLARFSVKFKMYYKIGGN